MKVKFKKSVTIKGTPYEAGKEYDVDDGLGKWLFNKDIAEVVYETLEPPETVMPKPVAQPATAPKPLAAYDKFIMLTEGHLAEIYGPYGCGKSRFVHAVAVEAQDILGKKVLFIDTEGGISDEYVKQLKNYWYIGDSIEALEDAVASAKKQRKDYDLLVVDSVGHPVYVNYVELESMQDKLRAYQRLALVFRDMVRFARGERGVDMGERKALSIATNHTVSEFARVAKDLPPEEPLNPFGGQIHRVPKAILRSELVSSAGDRSVFRLMSFKLRNFPKDLEVARFQIDNKGVKIEWKI